MCTQVKDADDSIVNSQSNHNPVVINSETTTPVNVQVQQFSSISLMLEYDIDNTLNTIKENGTHILKSSKFIDSPKQQQNNEQINENVHTIINDIAKPQLADITTTLPNTARKRWKILANVLCKDTEKSFDNEINSNVDAASVRRFKSFDLLRQDSFEDQLTLDCLGKLDNWYKYHVLLDGGTKEYSVNIFQMERTLKATDLMGFNNTGNICVWPSEEALTAYVLSNLDSYRGAWILELGGGFTCMAGLMLSKYAKPYAVHLTDGNQFSVENLKKTVCLNELSCYTKCSVLKWEDDISRLSTEAGKFNTILSADCLFFDETRSDLVDTIWYYLAPHGIALIMAPKRGKTMELFIDKCLLKGFNVEIIYRYNETIWQRHLELKNSDLYDEDLHYPVLLTLTKVKKN